MLMTVGSFRGDDAYDRVGSFRGDDAYDRVGSSRGDDAYDRTGMTRVGAAPGLVINRLHCSGWKDVSYSFPPTVPVYEDPRAALQGRARRRCNGTRWCLQSPGGVVTLCGRSLVWYIAVGTKAASLAS